MNRKYAVLALLTPVLSASAFGQISKTAEGYVLKAKYFKGQVIRFVTDNGIDSSNAEMSATSLKMPVILEVLRVVKGVATVRVTLGDAFMGGTKVHAAESATFPLDNHNRGSSGGTNVGLPLPLKPVKVGARWSAVMPVNTGGRMTAMKGAYQFAGMKVFNGHQVGVITYSVSGPASGTGTMMILASDGTMYRNETRLSVTGQATIRIRSTMTRVSK